MLNDLLCLPERRMGCQVGQTSTGAGIQNSYLSQHRCIDHLIPPIHEKANRTSVTTVSCLHSLEDLCCPCYFYARSGERDGLNVNIGSRLPDGDGTNVVWMVFT